MPTSTQEKKQIAEAKKLEKQQKAEAAALLKAEKEKSTENTKSVTAKADRVIQNEVVQPLEGSKARAIWDLADSLSKKSGETISLNDLVAAAVSENHSGSTVFSEYSKWRKFNGISGRTIDPVAKAQREAEQAKAKEIREAKIAARAAMPVQNDVRRPLPETKAGRIWAILDELSSKKGEPVPFKEVAEYIADKDINVNSASGEYSLWRKFNGIATIRVVKPVTVESLKEDLEKVILQQGKLSEKRSKIETQLAELSEPAKPAESVTATEEQSENSEEQAA